MSAIKNFYYDQMIEAEAEEDFEIYHTKELKEIMSEFAWEARRAMEDEMEEPDFCTWESNLSQIMGDYPF